MIDNLDADCRTFGPERQLHDGIRGGPPVSVLDSVAGSLAHREDHVARSVFDHAQRLQPTADLRADRRQLTGFGKPGATNKRNRRRPTTPCGPIRLSHDPSPGRGAGHSSAVADPPLEEVYTPDLDILALDDFGMSCP
jgi:hypothetical protein